MKCTIDYLWWNLIYFNSLLCWWSSITSNAKCGLWTLRNIGIKTLRTFSKNLVPDASMGFTTSSANFQGVKSAHEKWTNDAVMLRIFSFYRTNWCPNYISRQVRWYTRDMSQSVDMCDTVYCIISVAISFLLEYAQRVKGCVFDIKSVNAFQNNLNLWCVGVA